MKKFVAFGGSGGVKSGIVSKEDAHKWAAAQLSHNAGPFYIAEVIESVERASPAIDVKSFFCQVGEDKSGLSFLKEDAKSA